MSYDEDDVANTITGQGNPGGDEHPWGGDEDQARQDAGHHDEHGAREPGFNYRPDAVGSATTGDIGDLVLAKKPGRLKTLSILVAMALLLSGFVGYVLVKALHLGQRREALPMTGPYGREASIQSGTQQYPGQMSGAQVSSSGAGDSASLGPGTGAAGRSVTGPGVFDTAPASTRGNGTVPGQGSIQPGLLPSAPASVQSLDQYPGQSASARGPAMPGAPQGSGAQGASPEIMVTPPVPAQPAVATAPVTAPATMDDDVSAQVTALSAQVSELASEVAALMPRGQNGAAVQAARAAVSTGHARERTRHVYVKHARRWGAIGGTATRSASIEGYSLKEIAPARDGESGDRATVVAPDGTTIDVRAGSSIGGTTVTSVDADAGVVHTLKGDIH